MGFFDNIGTTEFTKNYNKALKKLNISFKRHPENLVDIGDDKLWFVYSQKKAGTFKYCVSYNEVLKGISLFLSDHDDYEFKRIDFLNLSINTNINRTVNAEEVRVKYNKNNFSLIYDDACALVLWFEPKDKDKYGWQYDRFYIINNYFTGDVNIVREAISDYYKKHPITQK